MKKSLLSGRVNLANCLRVNNATLNTNKEYDNNLNKNKVDCKCKYW